MKIYINRFFLIPQQVTGIPQSLLIKLKRWGTAPVEILSHKVVAFSKHILTK